VAVMTLVLLFVSRPAIDFRVRNLGGTLLVGVLVFVLWIGPDRLIPGYRQHWLFTNALMGHVQAGISEAARSDARVLILRAVRASLIVPIIEELFWRGWLMRWLIRADFKSVPLGAYSAQAFWTVALLFAVEHGSYWEVGLVAGVIYNWWMVRTKSLGDLILAHAVTNGCLSAYVVFAGRWEYWG
jgi:CAAX prenyl protease-like protein